MEIFFCIMITVLISSFIAKSILHSKDVEYIKLEQALKKELGYQTRRGDGFSQKCEVLDSRIEDLTEKLFQMFMPGFKPGTALLVVEGSQEPKTTYVGFKDRIPAEAYLLSRKEFSKFEELLGGYREEVNYYTGSPVKVIDFVYDDPQDVTSWCDEVERLDKVTLTESSQKGVGVLIRNPYF